MVVSDCAWFRRVVSADNDVVSADNGVVSADNGVVSADNGAVSADNGAVSADNGAEGGSRYAEFIGRSALSWLYFVCRSTQTCLLYSPGMYMDMRT